MIKLHETDFETFEIDAKNCIDKMLMRLDGKDVERYNKMNLQTDGFIESMLKILYLQAMVDVACDSDHIVDRIRKDAEARGR